MESRPYASERFSIRADKKTWLNLTNICFTKFLKFQEKKGIVQWLKHAHANNSQLQLKNNNVKKFRKSSLLCGIYKW